MRKILLVVLTLSLFVFALPAHVDSAVFSTLPRPTAVAFRVCHDLSPRQY